MWLGFVKIVVGPFFNTLVKWRQSELAAKGSHEKIEESLTLRALELDAQEARLNNDRKNNIDGKWYVPENLFAYCIMLPYWFMAITMDYVVFPLLGMEHVTLPLKGETAATMTIIVTFWFGKRTVNTVGNILTQVFGRK